MGDELQCNVCYLPYNTADRRPWDIGCGHCYCEKCLRQSPPSFRHCPECRARAHNPHVSIALLRLVGGGDGGGGGGNSGGAAAGNEAADAGAAAAAAQQAASARRRAAAAQPPRGGGTSPAVLAAAAGVQGASAAVQRMMRDSNGNFAGHQQQLQEFKSSIWVWLTPLLGVLYALSPLDIIPDVLPIVGWMDDILVLAYVAYVVWANLQRAAARDTMRL